MDLQRRRVGAGQAAAAHVALDLLRIAHLIVDADIADQAVVVVIHGRPAALDVVADLHVCRAGLTRAGEVGGVDFLAVQIKHGLARQIIECNGDVVIHVGCQRARRLHEHDVALGRTALAHDEDQSAVAVDLQGEFRLIVHVARLARDDRLGEAVGRIVAGADLGLDREVRRHGRQARDDHVVDAVELHGVAGRRHRGDDRRVVGRLNVDGQCLGRGDRRRALVGHGDLDGVRTIEVRRRRVGDAARIGDEDLTTLGRGPFDAAGDRRAAGHSDGDVGADDVAVFQIRGEKVDDQRHVFLHRQRRRQAAIDFRPRIDIGDAAGRRDGELADQGLERRDGLAAVVFVQRNRRDQATCVGRQLAFGQGLDMEIGDHPSEDLNVGDFARPALRGMGAVELADINGRNAGFGDARRAVGAGFLAVDIKREGLAELIERRRDMGPLAVNHGDAAVDRGEGGVLQIRGELIRSVRRVQAPGRVAGARRLQGHDPVRAAGRGRVRAHPGGDGEAVGIKLARMRDGEIVVGPVERNGPGKHALAQKRRRVTGEIGIALQNRVRRVGPVVGQ